jgi:tetratricopeptide (TPR) repeat protein
MKRLVAVGLTLLALGGSWGCGSRPVVSHQELPPVIPAEPAPPANSDQSLLKEGLTGRTLPASEVAELSDRLLADGSNTFNDQETMARLELLILKSMKGADKTALAALWRNLGIIHYHQKKYKTAQHDLQAANEINPKNARTHYYLACLFAHQGKIYAKQGKKKVSGQQFKRAAIEMDLARKLAPNNSLYKQDPKQLLQQENGK